MDSIQAKRLSDSVQGLSVGGWHISGFFGNGKSAVVLPAVRDTQQGAIKIFHEELIERFGKAAQLERIFREKSLVDADHPNLVRILDGGECAVTGHLYVVMEQLPYENLQEKLATLPDAAVRHVISQIASAARYLEDRGLAHRDIKPENIAVADDFSRAILMDLGVLRPFGPSNLTDVDQRSFIGTLRYSSPEFLLRQEKESLEGWRAVTFYQLGAVLHDMLMKKPLFYNHSEPFSELVNAVQNEKPEIHAADATSVALANRCLVKNPTTRLELVTWSDFTDVPQDRTADAAAARARVRQQQDYIRATRQGTEISAPDSERLAKRALEDLCRRLESRIAALINDLKCFPLRATKSERDTANRRCTTTVQFERDSDFGLPFYLTVVIQIEMIDENNGAPIYRALSVGALSDHEDAAQLRPTEVFFTGELDSLLDGEHLEPLFVMGLERAYSVLAQGCAPSAAGAVILTNIASEKR
jgi:serine/threonine protein kinase